MKPLYLQTHYPVLQNKVYASTEAAINCLYGEIEIVEDELTGLIYNNAFIPELMIYDAEYQNEQALSPYFQNHLSSVAKLIERHMGKNLLIEVGCGKGYFLELLADQGFDISGFDPAYEGNNPRIQKQLFTQNLLRKSQGLILRHVLEHIQHPVEFLHAMKEANQGEGTIYIEVPCFDWICQHRAWFDIFYEHVNYFRLSDFHRMFSNIKSCGRLFGGQYLYVIADLSSLRSPKINPDDRVAFPENFYQVQVPSNSMLEPQTSIWGGSSKGVIFALLQSRAGFPVSNVIDINPVKQGMHIPGTGLRVLSPVEALVKIPKKSVIFVMNGNYLEEIKQMSANEFKYIAIDHS